MTSHHVVHDPRLGPLTLSATDGQLVGLRFGAPADGRAPERPAPDQPPEPLAAAAAQLREYLAGERRTFEIPLTAAVAPAPSFSRRVWQLLTGIPYGTTTTYGALADRLADRLERPVSPRAVATAVARTPVPIIIPCHRVIGADGSLRGYLGGLERKRALLELEAGSRGASTSDQSPPARGSERRAANRRRRRCPTTTASAPMPRAA